MFGKGALEPTPIPPPSSARSERKQLPGSIPFSAKEVRKLKRKQSKSKGRKKKSSTAAKRSKTGGIKKKKKSSAAAKAKKEKKASKERHRAFKVHANWVSEQRPKSKRSRSVFGPPLVRRSNATRNLLG